MPPNDARRGPFDRPYLLLTCTILFWSGNIVVGRGVVETVPPVGLAFWRWTVAFLVLLPFALGPMRRAWPEVRRHWPMLALLSLLGVACFNTLLYLGLQETTAINALLMQTTMPVVIVLMSFALFAETISALQVLGVAISLAGAVTVVVGGEFAALSELSPNPGDAWVAAAVLTYAAYSALLRRRPRMEPAGFLGWTFLLGALMLLPSWLGEHAAGLRMHLDLETAAAVGYVALFPSILAYLCYNRGVELVGANRAGLFFHLVPVFGGLMAVAFLGERFQWFHLAGVALILSGIVLATRRRGRTER